MHQVTAHSLSHTRRFIAVMIAVILITGAYFALRWIYRDITFWSRSTTFTYQTDSLETCARLVALGVQGVSVQEAGKEISLRVPGYEGAIVKPAPEPNLARLLVYGHSDSISRLGPASEEAATAFLAELGGEFTKWCSSQR